MPRKLGETGSEAVHFRAPPEQVAKLDRAAKRAGKNLSAEIRELLDLGYRARAIETLIAETERV